MEYPFPFEGEFNSGLGNWNNRALSSGSAVTCNIFDSSAIRSNILQQESALDHRPLADDLTMNPRCGADVGYDVYDCDSLWKVLSMPQLILEVDEQTIRDAQQLAESRKTTVSGMFTQMVKVLHGPFNREDLPPLTRRALGIAKLPEGMTADQVIDEARMRKYGGGQ